MVLVEAQHIYDSAKPAQPQKPEAPVQAEGESDEAFAQRLLEYNTALEAYNAAMLQYGADLSNYDLGEQKKALDAAQKAYDDIYNNPGQDVIIARNEIDKLRARYESLLSSGGAYVDDYRSALAARDAAQSQYDALVNALKAEQESNNKSAALTSLELQELNTQIEKQRQKLKELRGEEGTEILASVSGRVDSVECTAGQTVTPEQILCSIEVPDMGYSLSFSVTNEQARRLRVGDSTTVNNYYWGREIIATVISIKTDPKNPQSSKIVEFDLEGDVSAGSELSISIGQKSASYDIIVPNSSIRTDSNGSFVLVIEAKNSPLGNRYIAKRVAVEVIASDDVNSAVTGELGYGDFVITTSNGPVASGDQVRMADNGI